MVERWGASPRIRTSPAESLVPWHRFLLAMSRGTASHSRRGTVFALRCPEVKGERRIEGLRPARPTLPMHRDEHRFCPGSEYVTARPSAQSLAMVEHTRPSPWVLRSSRPSYSLRGTVYVPRCPQVKGERHIEGLRPARPTLPMHRDEQRFCPVCCTTRRAFFEM